MMDAYSYFERLAETAELIARHADYPGKDRVVEQCREEVEELARDGRIDGDQVQALRDILSGARQRIA